MTSRRDRPWLIPSLLMLLGSTALLSAVVRVAWRRCDERAQSAFVGPEAKAEGVVPADAVD